MNQPLTPPPLPAERSQLKTCLLGCAVIFLIGLVIAGGATFWLYRNFNRLAGGYAEQALNSAIDRSTLPVEEKAALKQEVSRLTTAYQDGRITFEDVASGMQAVAQSPIMQVVVVSGIREAYLVRSGLDAAEREVAERTLQRIVRGTVEKKIAEADLEGLLARVTEVQPNGEKQLKKQLTDDELRDFLAAGKELADKADIPDEDHQVDLVSEVRKVVDQILAGATNTDANPSSAPQ